MPSLEATCGATSRGGLDMQPANNSSATVAIKRLSIEMEFFIIIFSF
jgi:hypothetical protein